MSQLRYGAGALVALGLSVPGAVSAQQRPERVPPVGSEVRVLLRDSSRTHGTVIDTTPDAIALRRIVGAGSLVDAIDRRVPLDSVLMIEHRVGRRVGLGALTGAFVGILGGMYAGGRIAQEHDGDWGSGAAPGALVFGAVGALLGAFTGHYIGRWERVPGW